jgi:tetratricopeptide (TPR) repeat protein
MSGVAKRIAVVALALFSVTAPLKGQSDSRTLFEQGNQLYRDGDYAAALATYRQIDEAGHQSGRLYYNIANCHFKLGDLGRSILNYERALRLMPRDDDTRANLELARSLTTDQITPLPGFWLFRVANWWVHVVPRDWLIALVTVSYLALMTGLIARVLGRRPGLERWGGRVGAVAAIVLAVFAINLAVIELGIGRASHAVVLVDEVAVQSAPSDDRSLQTFTIHEGTKIRIDGQSGEWAEIVLADGKVGWVRREAFEII